MADDSTSTPPADIGQQPDSTWPNSTNLANSPSSADSNLANDQQATPSADPLTEPPKEENLPQAPSEIGQVTGTPLETTWPDSPVPSVVEGTKMANLSPEADSSAKVDESSADSSDLANPVDSTPPSIEPITTSSQEPISTVSANLPPPTPTSPPPPVSPSSPTDISPSVPTPETPTSAETTPEPSEAVKSPEEKDVQLPDNQATMEQQKALNDIPTTDVEKTPDQLANFKPEPPDQPQEAPLANLSAETLAKEDQNLTDSSQKSFGDLLSQANPSPTSSTTSTPSTPSVPSGPSSPPISFGDLIKDIKPEESVIPPPPVPPTTPPVSSNPPPISPSPPSSASPTPPSLPISPSLNRMKANQARSKKKQNHLNKIMELAKNAKSISNTDVQRLLRVSQSTATNYLAELAGKGLLKRQGTRGGAKYSL